MLRCMLCVNVFGKARVEGGALAKAANASEATSSQGSAHLGLLRDQSAQRYPHLGECARKNELKCVFVRCAMYVSYTYVCVCVSVRWGEGGFSIKSV